MKKLLHHSRLPIVCAPGSKVTLRYYSLSDRTEIVFENWVVSSWHAKGTTLNVRNPINNEVRKLKRVLILSVNNVEIYI